jgi:hypothetical protein
MARIRSIKPEVRTSLTVAQWPREVRYFFVLLWGYLDDHGYGVDDVRLIKADCFPLDDDLTNADIDRWLDLIAGTTDPGQPPPLCRYEVQGRRYLHAPKWAEHQRPQHPALPKHPPCPREHVMKVSGESHETLSGQSGGAGEGLTPEQGAGSREQGGVAGPREPRTRAAASLLGNALLDEHKRACSHSPPRDVLRRVGERIDSLLDDPTVSAEEVREGLRRLRSNRKWGPGMLPNLVDEIRQEKEGVGDPRNSRRPTADQQIAGLQALKTGDQAGPQPLRALPGGVALDGSQPDHRSPVRHRRL